MTTCLTLPIPLFPIGPLVRIEFVVGMALRAMRFGSMTNASQQIDLIGHNLQMIWIDAASDAAEMVKAQTSRYWSFMQLVRHSMRMATRSLPKPNRPVSICLATSHPDPTSRFCDRNIHGIETVDQRTTLASHMEKVH